MRIKLTAYGRRARSVCIVTDLPVRLQAKKKSTKHDRIPGAKLVRLGGVSVLLYLTATGELGVIEDPP